MLYGLLLGAKNSRITIGSGPRVCKLGMIDVRKYYHLYSWFSYDELRSESKYAYILLYAWSYHDECVDWFMNQCYVS